MQQFRASLGVAVIGGVITSTFLTLLVIPTGYEILDEWRDVWNEHAREGMLNIDGDRIELTREGLLHADALLPPFFEPEHQGVRYT